MFYAFKGFVPNAPARVLTDISLDVSKVSAFYPSSQQETTVVCDGATYVLITPAQEIQQALAEYESIHGGGVLGDV